MEIFVRDKKVLSASIAAVITRADGSKEDLGVIASYDGRNLWEKIKDLWRKEEGFATLQVNTGRAVVTALLIGGTTYPKWIGWGTGAGTTAATDTTLFTEDSGGSPAYARVSGTQTQQTVTTTNDTYQCVGTITANAAKTITNAGIFDASSAGNLYMKGDFSGLPLNTNDSITFTMKVQYS